MQHFSLIWSDLTSTICKRRITKASGVSIDTSQKSTRLEATGVLERNLEPDFVFFQLLAIYQLCELRQKKKKSYCQASVFSSA